MTPCPVSGECPTDPDVPHVQVYLSPYPLNNFIVNVPPNPLILGNLNGTFRFDVTIYQILPAVSGFRFVASV